MSSTVVPAHETNMLAASSRSYGKLIVKGRRVNITDIGIGLLHVGDTGDGKLFNESLLMSTKGPLRASRASGE